MKLSPLARAFSGLLLLATFAVSGPLNPPTSLSYTVAAPLYTVGMGITLNRPTVGGGQSNLVYTLESGALPLGISIGATGNLYGTPTQLGNFTPTIRVTNIAGFVETTLNLTVRLPTPSISYTPSSFDFPIGTPIVEQAPTNLGGAVLSWSISPDLTAATGLLFNTTTGRITGTPVYATTLTG